MSSNSDTALSRPSHVPITSPQKHQARQQRDTRQRHHRVGDYVFASPSIAKGSFAKVYFGHHVVTREPVAVKRLRLDHIHSSSLRKRIDMEIAVMRSLPGHRHVVGLLGVFDEPRHKSIFLVLEWCDGGDLAHALRSQQTRLTQPGATTTGLDEIVAKRLMQQIREALRHLFVHRILHRDLKPANFLLHRDTTSGSTVLKLADFGFATSMEKPTSTDSSDEECSSPGDDMFATMCGSPAYLAPEVVLGHGYTSKSDLWSVGIMLYELLMGYTPFTRTSTAAQHFASLAQMQGSITLPDELHVSDVCRQLVMRLLTVDAEQRLSWDAFFANPWFRESTSPSAATLSTAIRNSVPVPTHGLTPLVSPVSNALAPSSALPELVLGDVGGGSSSCDTNHHHPRGDDSDDALQFRMALHDSGDFHALGPQLQEEFEMKRRAARHAHAQLSPPSSVYDEFQASRLDTLNFIDDYQLSRSLSIPGSASITSPRLASTAPTRISHGSFRTPPSPSFFSTTFYSNSVPRLQRALTKSISTIRETLSSFSSELGNNQ